MQKVIDNAAGPTGTLGILIGSSPDNPAEWLIFFSTGLVLCQLCHYAWRFCNWFHTRNRPERRNE